LLSLQCKIEREDDIETRGQVDQAAGKVKQAVEKVVGKVKDAVG
jgi:uncharacterized protein YjbJ (UPF0337 family)